jgi:molybdopterin synthase sulfur carrier subunit
MQKPVNMSGTGPQGKFQDSTSGPESRPAHPPATSSRPPRLAPSHRVARAATITVSIPTPLRNCCAGASELAFPAKNVRAVLEELERRYPSLHRSICDETGTVRRHINLFVNTEHMRDCNGLDTSLEPGDVVTIMTAVSGG